MTEAPDIPGAEDVIEWFGEWPRFHDAEVLSITLDRSGPSRVQIHAWQTTRQIDSAGYYVLVKHAVVTFELEEFSLDEEGCTNTRVNFFNHQNVLSGAAIEKVPGGHVLTLDGIFGVDASITCQRISVKLAPGAPEIVQGNLSPPTT